LNYDPEEKGKKIPVTKWLEYTGKTKHLLKEQNKDIVDKFQKEVDRRFARIKAMSEHPDL
ncbi:Pyruvate:ferredoxin oxidoreductase, alpha subunit / Pyruvate:ferredoxin oxidoreductase, beta subunit, partial [hydrothermal vent metagenome]